MWRDDMRYALMRAREYVRAGDLVMARAMVSCAHTLAARLEKGRAK